MHLSTSCNHERCPPDVSDVNVFKYNSFHYLYQQERRTEKKANQVAFKEEKSRQEKQMLNLRMNVQGLKLS